MTAHDKQQAIVSCGYWYGGWLALASRNTNNVVAVGLRDTLCAFRTRPAGNLSRLLPELPLQGIMKFRSLLREICNDSDDCIAS